MPRYTHILLEKNLLAAGKQKLSLINKQTNKQKQRGHGCNIALPTVYFPGISILAFSDRTEHALMESATGESRGKDGRGGRRLPVKNI